MLYCTLFTVSLARSSFPCLFFLSPHYSISSVQLLSPTLCDPMDCSTPDLPVHHQLPEFTHTHAHWVGDAIQPSHPLSSPSPPALNLSQYQFSSVQSLSCVQLFVATWITARQAPLSIVNSRSSLRLMPIESVMPSNHLILCCLLVQLQSFQHQGLFRWVSSSHQVAKVLEFQL